MGTGRVFRSGNSQAVPVGEAVSPVSVRSKVCVGQGKGLQFRAKHRALSRLR